MRKHIASALVAALILTAPGLPCYAQVGAIVRARAAVTPVTNGRLLTNFRGGTSAPYGAVVGSARLSAFSPMNLHASFMQTVTPGLSAAVVDSLQAPADLKAASLASSVNAGPLNLGALLKQKDTFALGQDEISKMPEAKAKSSGANFMDRILGIEAVKSSDDDAVAPTAGLVSENGQRLSAFNNDDNGSIKTPTPPANNVKKPEGPRRGGAKGFLLSAARIIGAAGAAIGLQAAGAALLPAVFGLVPVAAAWAVLPGLVLIGFAGYARYRLGLRDSPRLKKVKAVLDIAIGAYLGALWIAAPHFAAALAVPVMATVGVSAVGGVIGAATGLEGTSLLNTGVMALSLVVLPALVALGAAGAIGLGPIAGMMMVPAMTTITFYLGRIIRAAESGEPFSVPGSMQKIRFPAYTWVMTGVVFALMTGFGAVYTNIALFAWMFFGNKAAAKWQKGRPAWQNILAFATDFNLLYLGLLAFTAATGFASPLTFIVLAFAPERAATWTERLLGRFLPKAAAAPSTNAARLANPASNKEAPRWPKFFYRLRTWIFIGSLALLGVAGGAYVFGFAMLGKYLLFSAAFAAIPFFFATKIIKLVMKAKPADRAADPEFFGIMDELLGKINAQRQAAGKSALPMPEMVIDPMPAPNAYATGRSPKKALVGVTVGIKEMTLEPENVRRALVSLLAKQDSSSKSFKVFRKAIAGSIPGIAAEAGPFEVSQMVERAGAEQLKALGVRMLRGVLAHEFSHVMDRHMLTGSIAGAFSQAIAWCSYGVMWVVGHTPAMLKSVWDRMLGRGRPRAPTEQSRDLSGPAQGSDKKPQFVEPISTAAAAIKGLPLLLKLLATLFGPLIAQISQMAASRANEGMADEDGAKLSEDPESLALALGMLMNWRPAQGFVLRYERLPIIMATSHMTTVNSLQQLQQAGALPKQDALSEVAVGKQDDFMFNLFITHPDTKDRIERLFDMSEALDAQKKGDSDKDGGDRSPPLALGSSPSNTSPAGDSRGGLFRGAWKKAKRLFRVLPDEGRNREFWKFVWGQALLSLGASFHYVALPGLVARDRKGEGQMARNRAANGAAQAASSLLTGPLVDRSSNQKVLGWTHLGRALLMLAVPVLFFHGWLTFGAFLLVICGAGFLQSTSINAGSVAFNRILADDEAYYNKANAVMNLIQNVVGVGGPLLAGTFIGLMDAHWGLLAGNALSYGVYGLVLLAIAVGYGLFLRLPRDELLQVRRDLAAAVRGLPGVKGVSVRRVDGKPVLIVEVAGDSAAVQGVPAEFAGYPVRVAAQRRVLRELVEGFRLVWADRFLRLYLLFSTLTVMIGDGLVFMALPRYISDVLGSAAGVPAWAAGIPLLGPLLGALTSKAGAFGLYLAVSSLGLGLSSIVMMLWRDKPAAGLEALLPEFRRNLALRDPDLTPEKRAAAAAAVREGVAAVAARTAAENKEFSQDAFLADLLTEVGGRIGAVLPADDARALMDETGLASALASWSERHLAGLAKDARREARTGLDPLQRQGRQTALLHAVGWLAILGVFLTGGLWVSVGAMGLAMLLQGPMLVAWSSLIQRSIGQQHGESMGKVYSALYFYQLGFSILGTLILGALMGQMATPAVLLVVAGVVGLIAVLDVVQAYVVFPFGRK